MRIRQALTELYGEELLFADGFDNAILGVDTNGRVVYDMDKMARILAEKDNIEYSEAVEFLSFNTWNTYAGENTPIFITKFEIRGVF